MTIINYVFTSEDKKGVFDSSEGVADADEAPH